MRTVQSRASPPWANLPNLFTFFRLVLVPFIVHAILAGRHELALALFAIAAATDVLDGAAARHLRLTTQVGAYFDPIADKFLLSGVFLALAASSMVPWWIVAIVIGRDLYILLGALTMRLTIGIKAFPPSIWGKSSTFIQILTVTIWISRNAFPCRALNDAASAVIWPCVALTVLSGLHYTRRGIQFTRAH